jgi:energy-coupling factor transport system ATP-binding protein
MCPLIAVQGLRHAYPGEDGQPIPALQGVDLAIEAGEFVALVGPNGSGKSTLAFHLNALLLPTSGEVWVDGLLTSDPQNVWAVRERVGMVFQNPDNQLVASTVEEDVAFGPENQGLSPDEIRTRVEEALRIVGLTGYRTHPPQMLSGGQKQLVAIAGALAARPACVVFDEPTSMLDPSGRRQVLEAVVRLNATEGLTVLLITHAMEEAAAAGRVVAMHGGRVVLDGAPQQFFEQPERLRALGLDLPPIVDIAQRLRGLGTTLPPDVLTVEAMVRALC